MAPMRRNTRSNDLTKIFLNCCSPKWVGPKNNDDENNNGNNDNSINDGICNRGTCCCCSFCYRLRVFVYLYIVILQFIAAAVVIRPPLAERSELGPSSSTAKLLQLRRWFTLPSPLRGEPRIANPKIQRNKYRNQCKNESRTTPKTTKNKKDRFGREPTNHSKGDRKLSQLAPHRIGRSRRNQCLHY